MDTLTRYLAVAAGGALGAVLRYYLGGSVLARTAAPFPTATFVINVTGSFVIGFFLTLATERLNFSPHLRLAVERRRRARHTRCVNPTWKVVAAITVRRENAG